EAANGQVGAEFDAVGAAAFGSNSLVDAVHADFEEVFSRHDLKAARSVQMRKGALCPVPEDAEGGGEVPAPEKQAHFSRQILAIFPEERCVQNKPDGAQREESRHDPI